MTLVYISAASLIGGLLSVGLAALVSFATRAHWVNSLISFAIGALLGAAFLEVLPYAFGNSTNIQGTAATVLGGILAFFVLEKLVLWRHCHERDCVAHSRPAPLILFGDAFHNFVDGAVIAAAFLSSIPLGVATSLAVVAHEVPQEVGDFGILLDSGYSRGRALLLNTLSSAATLPGAVLAYFWLDEVRQAVPFILALSAASFIYIAAADLIPGLHRQVAPAASIRQLVLLLAGIGTIALLHLGR